ncbi:hypothetical protein Xmir_03241 [Xenorhabdus miraniensis]|uniref:Uncharacterized protein n=1 Tax=Xenorhabdus miraniensis TaxID=351674 RepID=A0A2D0JMG6_9GAMM|nr:hypothetical protein Xmir_03241 [Xenorhabdus miraniensis]
MAYSGEYQLHHWLPPEYGQMDEPERDGGGDLTELPNGIVAIDTGIAGSDGGEVR